MSNTTLYGTYLPWKATIAIEKQSDRQVIKMLLARYLTNKSSRFLKNCTVNNKDIISASMTYQLVISVVKLERC